LLEFKRTYNEQWMLEKYNWLFRVSCGFPTELKLWRFELEEGLGGSEESAICWTDA
jgi:hypothetical protein